MTAHPIPDNADLVDLIDRRTARKFTRKIGGA